MVDRKGRVPLVIPLILGGGAALAEILGLSVLAAGAGALAGSIWATINDYPPGADAPSVPDSPSVPDGPSCPTAPPKDFWTDKDRRALIGLANEGKRGGISTENADTLLYWAGHYGEDSRDDRGTDHWPGGDHIHIGPINHIPVRGR